MCTYIQMKKYIHFYVRGSVDHNINLVEKKPTRCDHVVEFIIPMLLNCSTCFERHTAHHQELKTVIAVSGFTYVCGCWQLSWLSGNSVPIQPWQLPVTTNVCKTRDCNYSFKLLMMMSGEFPFSHDSCQQPQTYVKPETAITVLNSWWWAVSSHSAMTAASNHKRM